MAKYKLVDKVKLVSELNPQVVLAVVLDRDLAKTILRKLNSSKDFEISETKKELSLLKLRFERYKAILEENDLLPRPGRRKKKPGEVLLPRKEAKQKSKMCPGFGKVEPHLFVPKCGAQKMCPDCRKLQKEFQSKSGIKGVVHVTMRGSGVGMARSSIKTVDEVIDMLPGPERDKCVSMFSPAELKQYQIEKNKREVEKMRKIRNQGFTPDDPIMGVNPKSTTML